MKFGRIYRMKVHGQQFQHVIEFPVTLDLDVSRATFSSANKANFTIYNLNFLARRDIYFDRYNSPQFEVTLQAGYRGSPVLPTIFHGFITMAWTQRQGVNWVTRIEAFDGGRAFYEAFIKATVPPQSNMQAVVKSAVATMAPFGVKLGKVSDIPLNNGRDIPLSGNTWNVLKDVVPGDGQLFVDNGVCHMLNPQDFLETPTIPTISAQTGLIGTPRRIGNLTSCTTIFDPQYVVGQLANLESLETWMNNKRLKVVGIHHYGKISGSEAGDLLTDLSLFSGYTGRVLDAVGTVPEGMVS